MVTLNREVSRDAECLYLKSADENRKAAVGLKGSHVQIGNEVHNTHRPRHKSDLVLLIPQELDHLEKGTLLRLWSWDERYDELNDIFRERIKASMRRN